MNRVVSDHLGMPYDVEAGHDLAQRAAIEERLSIIGGENPDQLIAEAMTEYRNAPEPRPLAADIGDIVANRDAIRQAYEELNGPCHAGAPRCPRAGRSPCSTETSVRR